MIRFEVGELRLTVLDGGEVWLDGGAMFGVVPKPLWARLRAPDDRNRIRLAMNVLLIEDGRRRYLVDTGAGNVWDPKSIEIYGLKPRSASELLAPAGLRPDQIDCVVNTHLHFDHAGGNTELDESGKTVAAFPRAEYVLQRRELETARMQNERIRASYLPRHFEPLADEPDRLRLVEGEVELTPSLRLVPVPGHTPGMQGVLIRGPEQTVAFMADLVPTASHVPFPYMMGFDLEPLVNLETKKRYLPQAAREGWRVIFEHDADLPIGVLEEGERGRLQARPVELEV